MAEIENRRLFVGGLHSDTTEDHLRNCFKSFGSVCSVEIIQRKDDSGCPIKTFAYVNIDMTDGNLKKCVSILNNSKWKGNQLKIQTAKESFLLRLHKERSEQYKNDTLPTEKNADEDLSEGSEKSNKDIQKESSVPLKVHMGSSSPGTLVEGKRNWVVGKFGRVLPIMFLRRRDGRKISKFDPSQTTHCLKKVKDGVEPMPVSRLTWNLKERRPANSVVETSRKASWDQRRHDSRSVNQTQKGHKSFDRMPDEQSDQMSSSEYSDDSLDDGDSTGSCDILKGDVEDLEKDVGSDLVQGSRTAKLKLNSQDKHQKHTWEGSHVPSDVNGEITRSNKTEAMMTKGNRVTLVKEDEEEEGGDDIEGEEGDDDDDDEDEDDDYGEDEDDTSDDDEGDEDDDSDDDMEEEEEEEVGVKTECGKKTKENEEMQKSEVDLNKQNKESNGFDCNSSDFNLRIKEKKTARKSQNKVATVEEVRHNTDAPNGSKGNDHAHKLAAVSAGHGSQIPDVNAKPSLSNMKRLDALKKRQEFSKGQKVLIKDALQNIDCKKAEHGSGNHIVFEEEDREIKEIRQKDRATSNKKVSGSDAASWLGLDNEGDSSGEEEVNSGDLFSVKEQFEGKAGEKLFRLQKSFGGDERFKLDEKFLESDDESADTEWSEQVDAADVPNEPESEFIVDMHKEKEMYLSVLQKVLKGNVTTSRHCHSNAGENIFTDFSTVRYDPTKDGHEEFELKKKVQESASPKSGEETKMDTDEMLPQVSTDKFYDVDTSLLSTLFGKHNQDQVSSPFTFFYQEPAENDTTYENNHPGTVREAEDLKFKQWNPQHLPYDSSGDDEEEIAEEENNMNRNKTNSAQAREPEQLFFFHVQNPELKNRLSVDELSPFMRMQSMEQLNEHWVSVRSELTQDYKRKHKDAIRRQRKMATKRTKLR